MRDKKPIFGYNDTYNLDSTLAPIDPDICPNCGKGKMIGNATKVYPSYPPKYKCDFVEIK